VSLHSKPPFCYAAAARAARSTPAYAPLVPRDCSVVRFR